MATVSVTCVNYNGKEYLRECLISLYDQTYKDFEVIIVDNASPDGSAQIIEKEFLNVKLIKNPENSGYCKAQNIAIKASSGTYVLTLNLDIILDIVPFLSIVP